MADNTIKDLIEVVKSQKQVNVEMGSMLQSIDVSIKQQVISTEALLGRFDSFFNLQSDYIKDQARKEKLAIKPKASPVTKDDSGAPKSAALAAGESMTNTLIALPGLIGGNLIAGLVAVTAAFGGLRGWEVSAIKNIDKIGSSLKALFPESLVKSLDQKFIDTRVRIMRQFGLDPTLGAKDAETGKRTLRTPLLDQINNKFRQVRTDLLQRFGIGADGKAIVQRGADGKFTGKTIWATATERIGKLLDPVIKASDAVGDFFKGVGKPIADFMKNVGSKAGGFLGVVGKILKPIGFIFSAWDGITAYMDSDKDGQIARLGDGVGAFIGDFIGAPFDLLKEGISWILKKFFNVETDDEGNAKPGQGLAGWAVTKLNSFSFEETIGSIVSGLFGVVQGAVDWVKLLFTDPSEALTTLWEGLLGAGKTLLDILWMPANKAIDWVTKKFGWRDEDAPAFNLREYLQVQLTEALYTVKEKFNDLKLWFSELPGRILLAVEEFWENLKADFKIGLIELSDWMSNLPSKILAAIINILDKASFVIPDNAATRFFGIDGTRVGFVSAETVAEANAAANAPRSSDSSAEIARINESRDAALQSIEDRRAAAERARMQQADALATDAGRERRAAMISLAQGGNTMAQEYVTNNYYTQTPGSTSTDPAM